ncbi:MAG: methionyl-tRNA formyltransferase, partial [Bacteroidota bacterium]
MTGKELRIVFMGTPDFAVASLQALVENDYNIVGVVTAPDKPAGRGKKLTESAVKKYAVENNLTVLQPEKLKNPGFVDELKALKPDLQVVVAFRMLPEVVWAMP